jgi:hypothetical protein
MPAKISAHADNDRALVALILDAFPLPARAPTPPPFDIEWGVLLERARFHGLSPLLHAALDARPRADAPTDILEALTDVHRSSALATAAKYHELETLLPLLHAAELPCIVLKGAALAKWLYPAPDLRPFGDVDLLVQAHDAPRLRDLLQTRGYRASDELAEGFRDAYYSEMAFVQSAPPHLALDAHWHLFVPLYFRARMDVEWFWKHTIEYPLGTQSVMILHPTAQLLHLTVHASLNHQHAPRLLWLYDLALLLTQHGAEIDWDAAAAFARASRVTRSASDILAQMEQWWGVAAPAPFLQTLKDTRVAFGERIAFAFTAARHNQARVLSDAFGAPGVGNKLRYGLRHLFPDAAYMTQHYRVRHPALLSWYYLKRVLQSGGKFARSVLSALTR